MRVEGGDPASLESVSELWVVLEDAAGRGTSRAVLRLRDGRAGECRVQLDGIADRDAAEALRGATLWVRAEELPALAEGEYYAYELVGCAVEDTASQAVGTVARIVETGAQDLLVVASPEGAEHLVPASAPILHAVDVAARRIVIDPPPGLLDAPAKAP